jgi:hypothetical protein
MINQVLTTFPITTLQIPHVETFQQEFGLIEPGSMCWRK